MFFLKHLKNIHWLSFGKIRVGYAEVGSDGDVAPYADQLFYSINSNTINNPSGQQLQLAAAGATIT